MNDRDARIAIFDLLITHIDGLTKDNTLAAWANRVPSLAESYCLLAVISRIRTSTNITEWSDQDHALTLRKPVQITLQADFRGAEAQEWAEALSVLWPSQIAVDVLSPHGCQPLYTSEPQNMTGANAEGQFEPRWIIELLAAADSHFSAELDYFENVDLTTYPQL